MFRLNLHAVVVAPAPETENPEEVVNTIGEVVAQDIEFRLTHLGIETRDCNPVPVRPKDDYSLKWDKRTARMYRVYGSFNATEKNYWKIEQALREVQNDLGGDFTFKWVWWVEGFQSSIIAEYGLFVFDQVVNELNRDIC